jgi:MOSC domain-containing protein YiiM
MKMIKGKVVALNIGAKDIELTKQSCLSLEAELDGFVGDRHQSAQRACWIGDKQAEGVVRRNERQWSAMAEEELLKIEQTMDLKETLTAASLGVNICFKGIPDLSLLPKGTILKFPSGAELQVEEYNPPCIEMGEKVASSYSTHSGRAIADADFPKAAAFCRGVVGVVEVAGTINLEDEVIVIPYQPPVWISRLLKQ